MQSSTLASWVPAISPSPPLKLPTSKPKPSAISTPTTTKQAQTQRHFFFQSHHSNDISSDFDNSTPAKFPLPPPTVTSITSTANPFVKHCVKLLRSSPYRHTHGSVLLVGTTPIREINEFQESLQERTTEIECLFLLDKAVVPEGLEKSSARMLRTSAYVMKKLSQLQSTESIEAIALMRFPTSYFVVNDHQDAADCRKWFPSPHRILVLEGIQDPGNLGTLLRSAVAFRWGGVFLLPGCCDPFHNKVLKASRGASFQLPIVSGSWHHLEALKENFQLKMLAGHPDSDDELKQVRQLSQEFADTLDDVALCLVLGNEGHGLTEKALKKCELVSIPMSGQFESLNVAVAGGIFMYMLQSEKQRIA